MYLIRTVRNLWREARLTCAGNSMVDGRQMPKCHGGGKDVRTTISLEDWTCRSVSRFVGRSARNGSQDARRENQRLESRAERERGLDQLMSVCVCAMRRRIQYPARTSPSVHHLVLATVILVPVTVGVCTRRQQPRLALLGR
jgi:hypothetical protein